jgi:DNA-binding LacI/PurR family transcriptional regulator
LREAGIEVDDKLVFQAGRSIEDGAKAATQMINEACDATAVQAVSDLVAIGCSEMLLSQGLRVPEDVSVVGFGNILLSHHYRVPLTTVRQAKFRLGSAAMDTMSQLLRGQKPEPKRLSAELIVRASSGIPPATNRLERLKTAKNETTII